MWKKLIALCVLIYAIEANGQNFIFPVQHEMRLAGTFGELRTDHFHMGIDIKSKNRSAGDPILAVEKGYVSRIKISRSGYGNALYIDHPSGHTTVYAHLRNYSNRIDSLISKTQTEMESFEIDIDLQENEIPVEKGEIIGNMGNSGSSYGPHLHFEIRDTESETPLNPMKFGFIPKDDVAPLINKVKIYSLSDKIEEISARELTTSLSGKNEYRLPDQRIGAWRIGIGVNTYDPMNSGYNKNGVYKIQLFEDGELRYSCSFDSISYNDTKYINAHIDYEHFKKHKSRFHKCFLLAGNRLPVYDHTSSIIQLFQDVAKSIEVKVSDFNGNISSLKFKVKRDTIMDVPEPRIFNYFLPYNEPNIISFDDLKIVFPDHCFYQDEYLYLGRTSANYAADIFHIGNETRPIHSPYSVYFNPKSISDSLKNKLCVVECSGPNYLKSYGGHWEGDIFKTRLYSFGNFTLTYDTIPPTITALSTPESGYLKFKIEDNFSNSGDTKGLQYKAWIDGKWAKFSYDLKTDRITHKLKIPRTGQAHTIKLEVTDDRENTSSLEKNFTW